MDRAKDLIEQAVNKSDEHIYIPTGTVSWRLPTGILSLDRLLGGGLPSGSMIQIYGLEKSGKTTIGNHILAESVRLGYDTVLISLEKYSERYAQACGIDTTAKNWSVVSADYAEYAFNLSIELIRNTEAKVILMDSIAAAISKSAIEKKQPTDDMDKSMTIGLASRTIADFVSKLQQPIRRREAIYIFINQLSSEIGRFYTSDKPKGGKALQYFTDIKLSLWGKENREKKCTETRVSIEKCKDWDTTPFSETTVDIYHGMGVDKNKDLLNVCEKLGIINKKGAWFYYGKYKWQGISSAVEELKDNDNLVKELYDKAVTAKPDVEEEGEE